MLKRKNLYAILGAVGALVLLFGGLAGATAVYAQEVTPESEGPPAGGIWGWGRGLFGFGHGDQWTMFDTAADALGLTPEELFSEMRAGKTLEEVAEEQGVELEDLQEAMTASRAQAMRDAIEQAVEDGEMSQEQADWLLEGLEKGYMPGPGFDHGFGHGRRGRGMRGGFGGFTPRWGSSDTRTPTLPSSSSL